MKRATAIRSALTIAGRLKRCAGIIGTPDALYEGLRVRRAWLFGSAAKGADRPSDVDVLLEASHAGRFQARNCKHATGGWKGYRLGAWDSGCKYLRGRLKMVRFHDFKVDGSLGDIGKTRIMIYPRNDLVKA
jgi:hypothetical protein